MADVEVDLSPISGDEEKLYDLLKDAWERARVRFQKDGDDAYAFKEDGKVNLLGARGFLMDEMKSCCSANDKWDDTLFVVWKEGGSTKRVQHFKYSSEHGKSTGVAILTLGLHKYKLDYHHKDGYTTNLSKLSSYPGANAEGQDARYRALMPTGDGVDTIRDNNKNNKQDADEEVKGGNYSINIHYGGSSKDGPGGWSSGCQVIFNWANYRSFIKLIESDATIEGSKNNEMAPKGTGDRPLIYCLVEGSFLKQPGGKWVFPLPPHEPCHADAHYQANEGGGRGFYPIGWNRIWHGGVHLPGQGEVRCAADGKIVAARMFPSDPSPVGGGTSRAFVLVQHTLPLKDRSDQPLTAKVWTLYYHLAETPEWDGTSKPTKIRWLDALQAGYDPSAATDKKYLRILTDEDAGGLNVRATAGGSTKVTFADGTTRIAKGVLAEYTGGTPIPKWAPIKHEGKTGFVYSTGGRVELVDGTAYEKVGKMLEGEAVSLDIPVACEEVIGFVGKENGEDTLHFEVWSEQPLDLKPFAEKPFEVIKDPDDDPVVDVASLIQRLDTSYSITSWAWGTSIDAAEIKANAAKTRHLLIDHYSEWAADQWDRLKEAPWNLTDAALQTAKTTIERLQFWKALEGADGMPASPRLVSYHPITFVKTIQAEIDRQKG